eukprot:763996-Hanusia_phi.AAC.6
MLEVDDMDPRGIRDEFVARAEKDEIRWNEEVRIEFLLLRVSEALLARFGFRFRFKTGTLDESPVSMSNAEINSPKKLRTPSTVAVLAQGYVQPRPSFFLDEAESRKKERLWLPAEAGKGSNLKGMRISINNEPAVGDWPRISYDSGPSLLTGWRLRQVEIDPPFSFPVSEGSSFVILSEPNSKLSRNRLWHLHQRRTDRWHRSSSFLLLSFTLILVGVYVCLFQVWPAFNSLSSPAPLKFPQVQWNGEIRTLTITKSPYLFYIRLLWTALACGVSTVCVLRGLRGFGLWGRAILWSLDDQEEGNVSSSSFASPKGPMPDTMDGKGG